MMLCSESQVKHSEKGERIKEANKENLRIKRVGLLSGG
jgi:hypothetical protein